MNYLLTIDQDVARGAALEGTVLARERAEIAIQHGAYHAKLQATGGLLDGARLRPPAEAVRVTRRGGATKLVDGPFAEAKEVIGGYYVFGSETLEEALALFRECPMGDGDLVSLRPLASGPSAEMATEGQANAALPGDHFVLLGSSSEHDVAAWTRAMDRVQEDSAVIPQLRAAKAFVIGGRLTDVRSAHRMTMKSGQRVVSDGPFAEAKEIVGGFMRIRCDSRADAVRWAERWSGSLHAVVDVIPVWPM